MSETITLVPGALSLDTLRSIYRGRPALTLDPAAYPRMERSRALIDRIAGGKPFDISQQWYLDLLAEIGQPAPVPAAPAEH